MLKKEIVTNIDRVLEKHQFRRTGQLWNRNQADFVDVIDLQISKLKDMFTLNIGVAERFVVKACWGLSIDDAVDEPSCTVRARLGELLHGRDVWWNLADIDLEEVLRGIEDTAMPFLRSNHSIDHMIEALENGHATRRYPPGVIYLALLYYRKGERGRCRETLRSAKLTGPWAQKAADIFASLT